MHSFSEKLRLALPTYRNMIKSMDGKSEDESMRIFEDYDEMSAYTDNPYLASTFCSRIERLEAQLQSNVLKLSVNSSRKGYVAVSASSPIGCKDSSVSSLGDLLHKLYPGRDFRESYQDNNFIISHDANTKETGVNVVIDETNNAFCLDTPWDKIQQLVPIEQYIGPYMDDGVAKFRYKDGTIQVMRANEKAAVDKYLELIQKCPGVGHMEQETATLVATYFTTPEELEAVNSTLEFVAGEAQEQAPGITVRETLNYLNMNKADYLGIAKLVPFADKYDDVKLLNYPIIYTDDFSEKIEDEKQIEAIQDEFGRLREYYYGDSSMLRTLDIQLGMSLRAHDMKKEKESREDAANVVSEGEIKQDQLGE